MNIKTFFAHDPNDADEVTLEKFSVFLVAGSCCVAGTIWAVMYYFIFGFGLTSILPFSFVVIVGTSLVISHVTRNHLYAIYTQIVCIIFITTFIQWSIGGVFDSGFVMAWAFCGPITALMFFSIRESVLWLIVYLTNVAITVVFNEFFSSHGLTVPENIRTLFFVMNLSFSSVVVFIFASYFVSTALSEREKANRLLLNILPNKIAKILKKKAGVIADAHSEVTVLFADIVGFTQFSSGVSPEDLVSKLNQIFLCFDELAENYGLEKIKTIGDAYMVVGGLPEHRDDHAQAVALMALDMMSMIKNIKAKAEMSFSLRIGIHTGPVVAGVIGKSKFAYDLWGDSVNVASRMESSGKEGSIQVSEAVYERLKDDFALEKRGTIEIKGKGAMDTYFLTGKK